MIPMIADDTITYKDLEDRGSWHIGTAYNIDILKVTPHKYQVPFTMFV